MPEENNHKIRNHIYIILGLITLAGIFAGGVLAWGDLGNKIDNQIEKTISLTVEGCKPAQKNGNSISLIEYRLNSIDKKQETFSVEQKDMRKENEAAFKEILKRLAK